MSLRCSYVFREEHAPFLDKAAYDTKRVVQGALGLLQDQAVGTRGKDADRAARILNTGDANNLDVVVAGLLYKVSVTELVFSERIDVSDRLASQAFGQELDLVTLNVLHNKNVQTLQEGQRSVINGVTEDGLLNQENVAVRLLDLFADI